MTDILYIAGYGRSGSTLLESVLHARYDVLGVGELFFIWDRGFLANEVVGEGEKFRDSEFWSDVLNTAYGKVTEADARRFSKIFAPLRGRRPSHRTLSERLVDMQAFAEVSRPLYEALYRKADGRIIVDSSKYPLYAAALNHVLPYSIGIAHVYRHPCAVAYSWSKTRQRAEAAPGGQLYMARARSVFSTIWRWKWFNKQALRLEKEFGLKFLSINYENFCDRPELHLDAATSLFGLTRSSRPAIAWQSVSGNPSRFEGGFDQIHRDDNWTREMPFQKKIWVDLLCGRQYRTMLSANATLPPSQPNQFL